MGAQQTKASLLSRWGMDRSGERDLEALREIADDVIESDFVPYAGLLDKDTIVTKNGEVLQTLRITGLGYDIKEHTDLRGAIRDAIARCIPDTSYALWLHTLRRKQSLITPAAFADDFSRAVDAAWCTHHPVQASYVNELYITVVKAAQQAELTNMQALTQSLWPPHDKKIRTRFIDQAMAELTQTCNAMLGTLQPFGAVRLSTVERDGVFYGEHLEFLEKLINLEHRPMPIAERDLSQALTLGEITFGHHAMEVRTAEGHRRFAALLTVKEYKESSLKGIDKFLEIPCELMITQCFDFIEARQAQRDYQLQARYAAVSGDKELAQWTEIDRLSNPPGGMAARAYGEQQTSIFIIAPSVKALETQVRMAQKALNKLGMVVIREDLRLEDGFWAQLPSNFPFVARKRAINTGHLAGFANLQHAPMGSAKGDAWGPPVTLFSTINETPYFFNFHRGSAAHSVVLGAPHMAPTALAHFLIAQSRKLNLRLWYLDANGSAENMIRAMGGTYATPGTAALGLNPFRMEDTAANREFLAVWLSTLVDPSASALNASSLGFFQQLVHALYALPKDQHRLSGLIPIVKEHDALLAGTLQAWSAGYKLGELFDLPNDRLTLDSIMGINLSTWRENDAVRVPLVSYLLHRFTAALDGTPTLIVLGEGFDLLNTPLFGTRAPEWLDHLATQNTGLMLLASDVEASSAYPYSAALTARAASVFAMPNPEPGAGYFALGLQESDIGAIAHTAQGMPRIWMRRGSESAVVRFDMRVWPEAVRRVLAGVAAQPAPTPEQTLQSLMHSRAGASG